MGPHDGTDNVVGVVDTVGPLPHGLVDRILENSGSGFDTVHLGSQELHPVDVQGLPPGVLLSHEDLALESEVCGECGGGHTVLTGTGLGDDTGLPHLLRQETLSDDVVDLV